MENSSIQQFVRLRQELSQERGRLEERLRQINEALGGAPLPSLSPIQGATGRSSGGKGRRGKRGSSGGQSLRERVLAVLQKGPMTKDEVLAAVQEQGYTFSTNNPMNSLGVILYGKNPKFNRVDGKFSLAGGAAQTTASKGAAGSTGAKRGGTRRMSAAGRKATAEAASKRSAAAKAGGKRTL